MMWQATVGAIKADANGENPMTGAMTAGFMQLYGDSQRGGSAEGKYWGEEAFGGGWMKITAWNFENRDAINNKLFKGMSFDEMSSLAGSGRPFMDQTGFQAKAHSNGIGKGEYKFVHRRTGAEYVFDGDNYGFIGFGPYKGTANYINSMDIDEVTLWNSPVFVVAAIGHGIVDFIPAYVLGVERR